MTPDALFVFGVLAAAVVLFASDRLRSDVVALLVIVALILGGILPVSEAVAGFGDSIVILIAALFVVGEGLVRTGVCSQIMGIRRNDIQAQAGIPLAVCVEDFSCVTIQ